MSTSRMTLMAQGTVPPFLLLVPTQLASKTLAYAPAPKPPRMTQPGPKASTTWLGIWPGSPRLVPLAFFETGPWSTPAAGRSECHQVNRRPFVSRNSVSASRAPAKKRIMVYVSVLCEPFMLARVTGYRAYVRCSLPTAGAAKLMLGFARSSSVAGVKADAGVAHGLSAGLGGGAFLTHSKQRCSPSF